VAAVVELLMVNLANHAKVGFAVVWMYDSVSFVAHGLEAQLAHGIA
jgi:hypothetical protein